MTRTAIRHPLSALAVVALVSAFTSNPVWGSPARQNYAEPALNWAFASIPQAAYDPALRPCAGERSRSR